VQGQPSFYDALVGKRIAGRYVVEKLLGSGGMGVVASAKYPELGQRVAIKFLRPELAADPVVSARFSREARVAAKVTSAHFVRVFDVGKLDTGMPYLVMELLAGRDLGEELRARGKLPIEEAVDWVLQACIGIAEIHALGIVHRDLKPSNLFLATGGGARILKVLDFGISKEAAVANGAPLTNTDHVLGTPQYMSPEQIRASRDVDARSDVWSLGVVLYELLTQSLPFVSEGGGIGEIFGKVLYVDPEPLRARRDDVPEALERVVLRCIARDRDARYANVTELAEALGPFLSASAQHRVEAVRNAASARPSDELEADAAEALGDSAPPVLEQAPTQESSPAAKREKLVAAKTTPAAAGAPADGAANAPVTAMTSTSSHIAGVRPRTTPWIVAGALAAAAVTAFAVVSSRPDATRAPAPAVSPPLPAASPAEHPSASPVEAPALVTAEPVASAPAAASTAPARPSAPPRASASPRPPPPRPAASASASVPPAAAPAPTLILDRK